MIAPIVWVMFALVALLATLSVTEMVRLFAHRLRAVDRPGGRRLHRRPTPRLGGLGIYWGFYVALALATYGAPFWRDTLHGPDLGLIGMMMGSSLLLIVGVMDDVYGLPAVAKLGFQFGGAVVLYGFGWRVETVGIPGLGAWAVGAWSLPLTVAWVLTVTNAVNLIDGMDGLACGVALIGTVGAGALLAPGGGPGQLAAASLAGALVGFLWFNLPPALIFLGDAGSLFLGYVVSALSLRAAQVAGPESFPIVPVLLLVVPLFDTVDAIQRRAIAAARDSNGRRLLIEVGARVFQADDLHVHHRLVRAGYSTRRAVVILWVMSAGFALAGFVLSRDPILGFLTLATALAVAWRVRKQVQTRVAQTIPNSPALPAAIALAEAEGAETESPRRAA